MACSLSFRVLGGRAGLSTCPALALRVGLQAASRSRTLTFRPRLVYRLYSWVPGYRTRHGQRTVQRSTVEGVLLDPVKSAAEKQEVLLVEQPQLQANRLLVHRTVERE